LWAFHTVRWLVGSLEFSVPFQHKYGYVREEVNSTQYSHLVVNEIKQKCIKTKNFRDFSAAQILSLPENFQAF